MQAVAQSAEGVQNYVASVRTSRDDPLQEYEWFLCRVAYALLGIA